MCACSFNVSSALKAAVVASAGMEATRSPPTTNSRKIRDKPITLEDILPEDPSMYDKMAPPKVEGTFLASNWAQNKTLELDTTNNRGMLNFNQTHT